MQTLFKEELKTHFKTKETSELFDNFVQVFRFEKHQKTLTSDVITPASDMMCQLCNSALGAYMDLIREGWTPAEVAASVMELCMMLNLQTERVCQGAIDLNVQELHYITLQRPNLSTDQLCGIIFQSSCPTDDLDDFQYTINVDPNHPPLSGSKDTSVLPSSGDLKIVHLTDPHYDPSYMVGSWASCDEPVCCRYDQPIPPTEDPAVAGAGRWGDYRDCDSPLDAVVDVFTDISRRHAVS